jgi:hypothetical protein
MEGMKKYIKNVNEEIKNDKSSKIFEMIYQNSFYLDNELIDFNLMRKIFFKQKQKNNFWKFAKICLIIIWIKNGLSFLKKKLYIRMIMIIY